MRIDPSRYPRMFNLIRQRAQSLGQTCELLAPNATDPTEGVFSSESVRLNCSEWMVPMEVGSVRYRTLSPPDVVGAWLASSNITTDSELYSAGYCRDGPCSESEYGVEAIEAGQGTPFDTCVQLLTGVEYYYANCGCETPALWADAINAIDGSHCGTTDADFGAFDAQVGIPGWCAMVTKFIDPASAVISCSGYDFNAATSGYGEIRGLLNEVVNAGGETSLYLIANGGLQRLTQWLVYQNNDVDVAPMVMKDLVAVEVVGQDTAALAAAAVARFQDGGSSPGDGAGETDLDAPLIRLRFRDGSVALAQRAYLTVLPGEMPLIRNLEAWSPVVRDSLEPTMAVKVALFWPETVDLGAIFGGEGGPPLTPCVPGPCQRIILDGDVGPDGEPWMVRQVWLWDAHTILIYQTAPVDSSFPAKQIAIVAQTEGIGSAVRSITNQINEAIGGGLPYPFAARLKTWPAGSLCIGWKPGVDGDAVSSAMRRPLGRGVGLYYGNSEIAPTGDFHGARRRVRRRAPPCVCVSMTSRPSAAPQAGRRARSRRSRRTSMRWSP